MKQNKLLFRLIWHFDRALSKNIKDNIMKIFIIVSSIELN